MPYASSPAVVPALTRRSEASRRSAWRHPVLFVAVCVQNRLYLASQQAAEAAGNRRPSPAKGHRHAT
jgi:hypothetical protein